MLPNEVEINVSDLVPDYIDYLPEMDDELGLEELSDRIGDYLTDEYGYCNNGFEVQIDYHNQCIYVKDIDWDTDED